MTRWTCTDGQAIRAADGARVAIVDQRRHAAAITAVPLMLPVLKEFAHIGQHCPAMVKHFANQYPVHEREAIQKLFRDAVEAFAAATNQEPK
ncbi:hypothetical protein [Azohydromonas aeria]|uniref:hypothetical protein n=1 Tax=Azohydromonas aeria TaxID=2590212 RepID=UPI0012FB7182|nr:hypothetical protein [Azohydromonas aeria]